jgi:uncharacterized protein Yka (UPF0111/DUF47 family)
VEEDKIERTILFLLDNQAAHDVRLARLEEIVEKLTINQDKMQDDIKTMSDSLYEGLRQMNEGIEQLTQVCEQTVKQVQNVLELEIRNSTRIKRLENFTLSLDERVEGLENQNRES